MQDRCGQCNELSLVCVFGKRWRKVLYADESRESVSWLSWADKNLLILLKRGDDSGADEKWKEIC